MFQLFIFQTGEKMTIQTPFFSPTLDIDTNNKEFIQHIEKKILSCKNLISVKKNPSMFKGYHIKLKCKVKCDVCRLVFDDDKRFTFDQFRPDWAQNILFDKMEIVNFKEFLENV